MTNAVGNLVMDYHSIQGGVEIFLLASCHRNWDVCWPDGLLGSYVDVILPTYQVTKETCVMPKSAPLA